MKEKFVIRKIATKVVLTILLVILIPVLSLSVFSYVSSSNIVKENVRTTSIQLVKQAADSLSYIFSVGSDTSNLIYSSEKLQEIVMEDGDKRLPYIEQSQNNEFMSYTLNSSVFASSFIKTIYVLQENGTSWGSGTFSRDKLAKYNLNKLEWVNRAVEKDGEVVWSPLQYDRFSGGGQNTDLVLPVSRVMKNFQTLDNIAYIQVSIDGRAILEKIKAIKLGNSGRFFVVDEQGRVMIDPDLSHIGKPVPDNDLLSYVKNKKIVEFEFDYEGKALYGVKQPISNGWTIVGVAPVEELTGELLRVREVTVLLAFIFTIVAVALGLLLARRITRPINKLTEDMKLVGAGDFAVQTNVESDDEIGVMSKQFNHMISQIHDLLEQVKEEQVQKKEAELRAIKHRINPHFLFNTLSTIRWLISFKQTDKANKALSALIRLLEANMGKKGTFVTVKEEVDILEKFIDIMEMRYEQTFQLQVELDDTVEDYEIPRMLLQPLVENAIFHGIVPKQQTGIITILGEALGDGIKLTVKDNGVGFPEEKSRALNTQAETFVGIGLSHVYDSVRLYFASDSRVKIESDETGTTIVLILKS
ncbi:sensor histidine kinase [Bacillus sp. HMF5848]|uniref:sensor histidine kinase n=1 Tax=Bacillus sp. HMF5848 TaxID=2495421 RepID=UPI000F78FDA3|nr:sensor histidine kinase [Bacillus sp. HMF5848]RSK28899.1 sensor histidine kinase [Bacillus sp. HMF5848]